MTGATNLSVTTAMSEVVVLQGALSCPAAGAAVSSGRLHPEGARRATRGAVMTEPIQFERHTETAAFYSPLAGMEFAEDRIEVRRDPLTGMTAIASAGPRAAS